MLDFILFCCLFINVHSQDLPDELTESLLTLIAEERNLRAELEAEADLLEAQLDALSASGHTSSCGCPSAANPIAFSTTLSHDIATLGVQQAVKFDNVTLNVGAGYDTRHGIFTAPQTGAYEFTAAVLTAATKYTGLEIVQNGVSVAKLQSGDSHYYSMGTNAVALKLTSGDEVWVRHINQSDSSTILGESSTSFSGYLIDV